MKKKLLAALLASALAAGMLPTSACAVSSAYTSSNATLISFTDSAVTADGAYSGYEIEGTDVSITAAGTYVFSGDCDDGSITVKKGVTGVTLVLNGLALTNADSAAITLNKTAEAALIAAAGSENTVADTAGANDENAAVKVKSGASLSLSGTGTLTACGNAKNGIKGASDAVITVDELTLNIEAADDGLSCDDELTIKGGRVNITAGGDAVKASPDTDDAENPDTTSLGNVTVSGGTMTLTAANDGVQADGNLTISGGTFAVTANGGHTTSLTDDSASCKGLKAGKTLTVSGGTVNVDSADDALHANDVTVSGGTLTLASGDDAVHADNDLVVGVKGSSSTSNPKIDITASYEGLEGTTVSVYSGDIDVAASDDGVNAANSGLGERSDKYAIHIAGGDLYIDAGSDGLDSNNDISITGGRVEVYGADAMMDAAIDYDGTFTLSGGTLFGAGMEPGAGTQAYVAVGETSPSGGHGGMGGGQGMTRPDKTDGSTMTPPDGQQNGTRPEKPSGDKNGWTGGKGQSANRESALGIKKGSVITVQDASGKTLYTATALGSMSSVIFSSADIKEGETYTVIVDGTSVGTATAKLGTSSSSSGSLGPNQNGGQPGGVSGFSDVPQTSWFADAVRYVTGKSLMNGTSTTAFSPNENMSCAMLATVLYRMSGETAEAGSSFGDVSSSAYYAAAVNWASSKGIVNGTGADAFSPNASITREQLAAMLYRYAGEPSVSADLSAYTDAVSISPYAEKAVEWCVAKGILSGKSATRLAPQDTATRAECAAMLQRFAVL
ncbi:carbohydrate-binding domain-containing protein [Agathobaculum sp.]|uniref:carbohydrate-binding domain-containing protein n=1 Tax=Agathobaculum sp. TaxID=2048138 RepID=UPI003522BEBF